MTTKITYNDKCVRYFTWASIIWGIVAMLAGVIVALQLNISIPFLQGFDESSGIRRIIEFLSGGSFEREGLPYLTFGRLRPVHTNAAIFAFVGNMIFAGVYYSTQRLCRTRLASDWLTRIHFWGWQLIIVSAAITLPLGLTQGKEYAELIWPIDVAVAVIWLVFAFNFFWTLKKRNEKTIYVALWFYIATILTVTMLYVVNNLQIPTSLTHSYPIFAGAQDALVQWWYGHNAVAFFLTTPILGIMYYFLPKAANRPIYSYRLSVVHFWSLVFIYIWAGPHHLLNTALPEWLQNLGMLFSLMLWAPSWGGMLNGLLTLRGGWKQLQTDPVIKFLAAGVTFYGMSTFEGPLLAIKGVNAISHYTDWTVGHVHAGTLGWNGFMAAGVFYWMVPRLWKTKLYSKNLANFHFWIGFIGILLYVSALWTAGVGQALALNESAYGVPVKEFVQTLENIQYPLFIRSIGGSLYLLGFILLAYNLFMTCRQGTAEDTTVEVKVLEKGADDTSVWGIVSKDPFLAILGAMIALIFWCLRPENYFALASLLFFCALAVYRFKKNPKSWSDWHDSLTDNYLPFTVITFLAVAIGGALMIIPNAIAVQTDVVEDRVQIVYTPLELAGRDIYVSEGCYLCHSQMIRKLKTDYVRYGDYSRIGESIYDHPFQWGSMRRGPDLSREGGWSLDKNGNPTHKPVRPNSWHFRHFMNPRDLDSRSNMPSYSSMMSEKTDFDSIPGRIASQIKYYHVPFPKMTKDEIIGSANDQALEIAKTIVADNPAIPWITEKMSRQEIEAKLAEKKVVALIAYIQKLGAYERPKKAGAKEHWKNPDELIKHRDK